MNTEQTDQARPIIAAVDNTAPSAAALRWAASEALRRRTTLTVIHVDDPDERTDTRLERDPVGTSRLTHERVARRVASWLGPVTAEVDVTIQTARGSLVPVLTRAGHGAQLIVLGSPTCRAHERLADELATSCECGVAVVDESGRASIRRPSDNPRKVDRPTPRPSGRQDQGRSPCWSENR